MKVTNPGNLKSGTLVRAMWCLDGGGTQHWYQSKRPAANIHEAWGRSTQKDRVHGVSVVVLLEAVPVYGGKDWIIKVLDPNHGILVALLETNNGDHLVVEEETVQHDPG